jgi:transposase
LFFSFSNHQIFKSSNWFSWVFSFSNHQIFKSSNWFSHFQIFKFSNYQIGGQIISNSLDLERNRKYDLREQLNANFYLVKTGCQLRMMPGDFAPWKSVYYYFTAWKKNEIFEIIHESLVERTRIKQGKNEGPVIDAQSVKYTLVSTENKGFDAG